MNEAKLSIFGSMDAPVSVRSEGMNHFKYRISETLRQQRREMLFKVTAEEVRQAAEKYLVGKGVSSSVTVMAHGDVPPQATEQNWEVKQIGN